MKVDLDDHSHYDSAVASWVKIAERIEWMSTFEIIMLVCFGAAWPFSIARAIKTKRVSGKSPGFMVIVFAGYLSGIIHKTLYARDWVIALYVLNMVLIAIDLSLYLKYRSSGDGNSSRDELLGSPR